MLGLPWLQLRETAWEGLGAEEGVVRVTQPGVCVCMRVRVCVCVCVRARACVCECVCYGCLSDCDRQTEDSTPQNES